MSSDRTAADRQNDRLVGVCIPTIGRWKSVERLLLSLAEQELMPAVVLVVDAGDDNATEDLCARMASRFPVGVLRHTRAERGLPIQRRRGIELLRADTVAFVCMLDDDVTLEPDFLSEIVACFASGEGSDYGGISGYNVRDWGQPFERLERFYSRLGIYGGELRPGRWLFCGRLLTLARLAPFSGIFAADFLPGGHTVWRTEVFDEFLPPQELAGYALLEDVHFSLRVSTRFKLGVLGRARVIHEHAPGGRPKRVRMGLTDVRRLALFLRDCDPSPSWRRYAAFLAFMLIDVALRALITLSHRRWSAVPRLIGSLAGWVSCVVAPPARTLDALPVTRRASARPGPGTQDAGAESSARVKR